MVTVFPSSADSCSQLMSDSYNIIRQAATSAADTSIHTPMDIHCHRDIHHLRSDDFASADEQHHSSSEQSTDQPLACDKKMRREIANHNERKRMQSINAGFESLKTLLPRTSNSSSSADRLSKAAILQQAVDYIIQLMQERQKLIELNQQCMAASGVSAVSNNKRQRCLSSPIPMVKRRKSSDEEDSSDEGLKPVVCVMPLPPQCGPDTVEPAATIVRDRLKRRLPSQETTVDCSNAEQVAQTLVQRTGIPKDEMAVSSSDDSTVSRSCVSSSSSSSRRDCSSVSRRNLDTIVEAIRHLEGESFYSSEEMMMHSGDSDSDRDDISSGVPLTSLYGVAMEPYGALLSAPVMMQSCGNVQDSCMTLLRAELFKPMATTNNY